MFARKSFARKSLPYLMMLTVLAAYGHCMVAHGSAVQRQLADSQGESSTTQDESSCENESACICKGVVLTPQTELPCDDLVQLLSIEMTVASSLESTVVESTDGRSSATTPPLDGAAARARLNVLRL
ncbi:MAG: hypothetical protein RIC55_34685 [Pirellulaceae bacterium]